MDCKTTDPTRALLCRCEVSHLISEKVVERARRALLASGAEVLEVADLCGLAARRDPMLKALAESSAVPIVACYPRAVRWLFHRAGAPLGDGARITNARALDPDEVEAAIGRVNGTPLGEPVRVLGATDGWTPWFPVIDYDRCTRCRQCESFCLFGTFSVTDDEEVVVSNPAGCKTNCPACARICPSGAIIFPKYQGSPINGDEITDEAALQEAVQVNVQKILGDDIYAALAERRQKAKRRLLREGAIEKAEAERQRWLEAEATTRAAEVGGPPAD